MSEQNILNPSTTSTLNPDYTSPIKIADPQIIARWQARSGKPFGRTLMARGQSFDMVWDKRLFADYLALEQWFHQYEMDFFTFFDIDRNRYYSGMFADLPQYERIGFNQVTISAQFIVVPKLPLFQYPGNWGVESVLLDERNGYGDDLVKLSPTVFTNLLMFSEQFDNAVWIKSNATVVANTVADPLGGQTADAATFTGVPSDAIIYQQIFPPLVAGMQFTFSVWLKVSAGTPSISLVFEDKFAVRIAATLVCALNQTWQRFSVTMITLSDSTEITAFISTATDQTKTYHLWGAQLEQTAAMGPYVQTTSASASLATPTGRWDHRDSNWLLHSEEFDSPLWTAETNVTVTANNQTDPNGGSAADTIATGATAAQGVVQVSQVNARNSFPLTFSVWLKSGGSVAATLLVDRGAGVDAESTAITVTNVWQRFSFTHSSTWTGVTAIRMAIRITNATNSIFAFGAQLEYGAAATPYAKTVTAIATLPAPSLTTQYHGPTASGGFAYFTSGLAVADAAEWLYVGYGFRVWAYRGPDMGIMQIFLDGVSQGTVDLYVAAATTSAPVFTVQNVPLGQHRVKLSPTNTKNGASSAFIVSADAIEVMR